jgi:hypothetical protein
MPLIIRIRLPTILVRLHPESKMPVLEEEPPLPMMLWLISPNALPIK